MLALIKHIEHSNLIVENFVVHLWYFVMQKEHVFKMKFMLKQIKFIVTIF